MQRIRNNVQMHFSFRVHDDDIEEETIRERGNKFENEYNLK